MEKKEKILHKLNFKDYTNRLEKVLEKKSFSLQTKNLLLSMVYKIENAYPDYEKTKVEVLEKREFLEKIIHIIETKCNEIELISHIEENAKTNYEIDKVAGKIVALGNDFTILNAILEIGQDEICMPEEESLIVKSITYFLNLGVRMHEAEVIRDFNGWSWDINLKDVPNIMLNFIFQNFIYLLGYPFILQWIQNDSKLADYLILAHENLKTNFGEKKAKSMMGMFCKFMIEMTAKQDIEQKELWTKLKKESKLELEKLNDKKTYLEQVTKNKKELTKQIETIDKILNNEQLLQKEYEARNEKLPNKEKIFSIRHLINRLEIERQDYVDKLKQNNSLIDPKGYVSRKEELSKKVEFLDTLDLEEKEDIRKSFIHLCLLFLSCFQIKIAKAQTKQEIISFIYIVRYYSFLSFDEQAIKLKEIEDLKQSLEDTIAILLLKAQKLDVIDFVTEDEEVNYQIIRKLFDSKMIDLNHTIIETKVEEGKLFASYYDTNILENTCQIESKKTVKLKKKTKLFI